MAGWSMFANGTGLDSDTVNQKQKGILDALKDIDVVNSCDDVEVELRSLFTQALSVFRTKFVQASLGNGETVDLFKLFCVVGERGGFDSVEGCWNYVVEELGLDPRLSGCVKLVYFSFLYNMERCLMKNCRDDGELGHSESEHGSNFSTFSLDLGTKLRSFLADGKMGNEMGKNLGLDAGESRLGMLGGTPNTCRPVNGFYVRNNDDDDENVVVGGYENYGDNAVDPAVNTHTDLEGEKKSRKRKRVSMSKILSWMTQVAACPSNHEVVSMDGKGNELKALAIEARDFLSRKTRFDLNPVQCGSKDQQKVDLTRPEDKLRFTKRQLALQQSQPPSCYVRTWNAKDMKDRADAALALPVTRMMIGLKDEHIPVRVHSRYQVTVPKWTGEVYESEDKWLGTKVWPLQDADATSRELVPSNYTIGKGRTGFCSCKVPGSVLCVRFHIAERRMKLKLELGPAFFRSGFTVMGEEVSLRWTADEEKSFKKMVRCNRPSQDKNFWDYAHIFLPGKTRRELVSYYFNVFQLQRRSYQNRATPNDIDSEDDEKQFGSFTNGFGGHAIEVRNVDDVEETICALNEQCTNYTLI